MTGRRYLGDICGTCCARIDEPCYPSCLSEWNRTRLAMLRDCAFQARRLGIWPEWCASVRRFGRYPAGWIDQVRQEVEAA